MYQWIWRHLPGSAATRTFEAVMLVGVVVMVLLLVVFPRIDPYLPMTGVTVSGGNP